MCGLAFGEHQAEFLSVRFQGHLLLFRLFYRISHTAFHCWQGFSWGNCWFWGFFIALIVFTTGYHLITLLTTSTTFSYFFIDYRFLIRRLCACNWTNRLITLVYFVSRTSFRSFVFL
jgi:hypothetical protein